MLTSFPLFTVLVCTSMAVVMLILNGNIGENYVIFTLTLPTENSSTNSPIRDQKESNVCKLPKYDSWNPAVMQYVDLHTTEKFKCNEDFQILTQLEDRKLVTLSEEYKCKGRCITRSSDYYNTVGNWEKGDFEFDCDIVEARCAPLNETKATYAMVHTQVIPRKSEEDESEIKNSSYNVFVFLIDSMASSQADRNIPKTMRYLEKSMGAITFPYINKVGLNSRPNGFALWFGKQLEAIDKTVFGMPKVPPDFTWKESCDMYMDNFTSIFDEFRDRGYKTFLADDWARGMMNWPNCYGFKKNPADHNMQPFQIAVEDEGNELLNKNYTEENCVFMHKDILNYHQQFIDVYTEEPKFSWVWTSLLSHNYESSSMLLDTDLLAFLVKNRKVMDNSFIFLMGDHGLRFGKVTNTKIGALDVNNPMLTISVPKDLRKSNMVQTMKRNAGSLQTHYDTRATLLDIARHQPSVNFTSRSNLKMDDERGQSYLREQIGERSCRSLPIPFSYCICDMELEKINSSSKEAKEVGEAVINFINKKLKKVASKCGVWKFSKAINISAYLPREEISAYSIVAGVSAPYKKAQFRAVVHRSKDGKFTVSAVDRVDSYGKRGSCVSGDYEQICDCKKKTEKKEE